MRILEIGSLNINGSIRPYFDRYKKATYIGIDLGPGLGVDVVESGHIYESRNKGIFDLVISAECLEHNPFWKETIENAINLLKNDGLLLFSFATTGRPVHGVSYKNPESAPFIVADYDSYYRNLTRSDIRSVANINEMSIMSMVNFLHSDMYLVGKKGSFSKLQILEIENFLKSELLYQNSLWIEKSVRKKRKLDQNRMTSILFYFSAPFIRRFPSIKKRIRAFTKMLYSSNIYLETTRIRFRLTIYFRAGRYI